MFIQWIRSLSSSFTFLPSPYSPVPEIIILLHLLLFCDALNLAKAFCVTMDLDLSTGTGVLSRDKQANATTPHFPGSVMTHPLYMSDYWQSGALMSNSSRADLGQVATAAVASWLQWLCRTQKMASGSLSLCVSAGICSPLEVNNASSCP